MCVFKILGYFSVCGKQVTTSTLMDIALGHFINVDNEILFLSNILLIREHKTYFQLFVNGTIYFFVFVFQDFALFSIGQELSL